MVISISASMPLTAAGAMVKDPEQWLKIQSICNSRKLVSCIQVFNPNKPLSVPLDACVAIDQGGYGGIGCGCGGLTWERACTSSEKYYVQERQLLAM
jgi:hypothetical protein